MEDNYQGICYTASNLKQVIFRIDFSKPIPDKYIFNDTVKSIINNYFPIKEKELVKFTNKVSVKADIQTGNVSGCTDSIEGIIRTYSDNLHSNKVAISNENIIFTYNNYRTFEGLYNAVSDILTPILADDRILVVRSGLRYVNLYNLFPTDKKVTKSMFSVKLSKIMVPSLVDLDDSIQAIRSLVTTEYICDDIKIKYRAGLYNQFYPMPISKDDFVVDIDGYTNTMIGSVEELGAFIRKAHTVEQYLFEKSINNKMRGVMGNE